MISTAFSRPTARDPWSLGIQILGAGCGDQRCANAVRSCASDPWTSLELVPPAHRFPNRVGTGVGVLGPAIPGGTGSMLAPPYKASVRYNSGMGRRVRQSSRQSEPRSARQVSSQGSLEGETLYSRGTGVWTRSRGRTARPFEAHSQLLLKQGSADGRNPQGRTLTVQACLSCIPTPVWHAWLSNSTL